MSRIKNMPRAGWFIAGVAITVLLVPSGVAVAKALTYTGIEGTSGSKADVSPSGQLLTAPADPSSYFNAVSTELAASSAVETEQLYAPPSGDAAVVTTISGGYWVVGSITDDPYVLFYATPSGDCSAGVGTFIGEFDPTTDGSSTIPLDPGVVIPSGDALCLKAYLLDVDPYAQGYTIPSVDAAPALPAAESLKS